MKTYTTDADTLLNGGADFSLLGMEGEEINCPMCSQWSMAETWDTLCTDEENIVACPGCGAEFDSESGEQFDVRHDCD